MCTCEFQDSNHKFEALLLLVQPSSEIRRRVAWQSHVNDPEGSDNVISRVESEYGSKTFIISNLNITNVLQKHHILILYLHTAFLNIKTPLISSSVPVIQEQKIKYGTQKPTNIPNHDTFQI